MPRRNNKAKERGFESMSGSKIKALMESLQYEWKVKNRAWSSEPMAPCPAPQSRW